MDIIVKYCDLPCHIRSFVRKNEDDSYTVVINSRLGNLEQQKAFAHELKHIIDEDLSAEDPADEIEAKAHA